MSVPHPMEGVSKTASTLQGHTTALAKVVKMIAIHAMVRSASGEGGIY